MLESIGNAPQFKDSVRRAQLPAVIAQPALAAAAPIERQAVPHAAEGKAVDLTCGCSNKRSHPSPQTPISSQRRQRYADRITVCSGNVSCANPTA
jgi:hypothetical protein